MKVLLLTIVPTVFGNILRIVQRQIAIPPLVSASLQSAIMGNNNVLMIFFINVLGLDGIFRNSVNTDVILMVRINVLYAGLVSINAKV